jgi:hypothetical protein
LTEPTYQAIVDEVQAKYASVKGIDKAELALLVADIRKHWKAMTKKTGPKAKKLAVKTKKPVKKAAPKTNRKAKK